jgi:hypothetical protein
MADTRINALSTATSSVSDDFVPIDGTTNGTRKLSAFSPSFGGNATVGGTLTVNNSFASSASSTTLTSQFANTLTGAANILNLQLRRGDSANGFSRLMWGTSATTEWSLGSRSGDTNLYFWDEVANAERLKIASSTGVVTIPGTTASTSTSSGALVVGNGTSGGLGVGGAVNIGGNLTNGEYHLTNGTSTHARSVYALSGAGKVEIGYGPTGYGFAHATGSYIAYADTLHVGALGASSAALTLSATGIFSVLNTTASTSTSSGALVVSGGVGVAKEIVTGGIIRCGGSNGLSLGSDTGNIRIDSAGPVGVEFRGLSAADTITGFTMREMALIDGTTAPSTRAGYATIYVDTADGDLKVKFGDGTVKTIATDS